MEQQLLDVSDMKNTYVDLPYAITSNSQKLDLYLPENSKELVPVILHVHGGAFRGGDKRDDQVKVWLDGINRGYAVASINYRMSGEEIFPAAVIDCKAAIRYLKRNAEKFGIDKNKIAVVGGSAGGNLVLMIATTDKVDELSDFTLGNEHESCTVQACISWFPPTNFLQMDDHLRKLGLGPMDHNDADSPESDYMGGPIQELDASYVQKANPMSYINEDMPPMFIQHGSIDHIVPYLQSKEFVEKAKTSLHHFNIKYQIIDGADHADEAFSTRENMEKMFRFLDGVLK